MGTLFPPQSPFLSYLRIAYHICRGETLQDIGGKLHCKRRILAMPDADASTAVSKPLHLMEHELTCFLHAPALAEHFQRAIRSGLSDGADAYPPIVAANLLTRPFWARSCMDANAKSRCVRH